MKRYMIIITAVLSTAAVLALAPAWFGWEMPPWATAGELRKVTVAIQELSVEVAANTEASLLLQLENAFAGGNVSDIRRLCNIIVKLYGYKAAGCP